MLGRGFPDTSHLFVTAGDGLFCSPIPHQSFFYFTLFGVGRSCSHPLQHYHVTCTVQWGSQLHSLVDGGLYTRLSYTEACVETLLIILGSPGRPLLYIYYYFPPASLNIAGDSFFWSRAYLLYVSQAPSDRCNVPALVTPEYCAVSVAFEVPVLHYRFT